MRARAFFTKPSSADIKALGLSGQSARQEMWSHLEPKFAAFTVAIVGVHIADDERPASGRRYRPNVKDGSLGEDLDMRLIRVTRDDTPVRLEWSWTPDDGERIALLGIEQDAVDGNARLVLSALPLVRRGRKGPLGSMYSAEELQERIPKVAARLRMDGLRPTYERVAPELDVSPRHLKRLVADAGLDWRRLVAAPK